MTVGSRKKLVRTEKCLQTRPAKLAADVLTTNYSEEKLFHQVRNDEIKMHTGKSLFKF